MPARELLGTGVALHKAMLIAPLVDWRVYDGYAGLAAYQVVGNLPPRWKS